MFLESSTGDTEMATARYDLEFQCDRSLTEDEKERMAYNAGMALSEPVGMVTIFEHSAITKEFGRLDGPHFYNWVCVITTRHMNKSKLAKGAEAAIESITNPRTEKIKYSHLVPGERMDVKVKILLQSIRIIKEEE